MHCSLGMRWHVLGLLLLCSATVLAQPRDAPPPAPLPTGPSGDAGPVDPYANPSQPPSPSTSIPPDEQPAAPAPSQQQAPAQAPAPNTTPPDARPQPPASEQKPLPPIDKPAPMPTDQPTPTPSDKPAQLAPMPMIDAASAPPACRDVAGRALSPDRQAALPAKISFAICSASAEVAGLQLVDAEASVREVDRETANAFAILDEVAASGDPRWQIVALHAEGDLLAQMTRRMLDTVPPPGANAPPSAVALHDSRAQLLQPHLEPWLERTHDAFAQVDQLAKANPQLTRNQVVNSAVTDSRRRLTNGLATR